MNRLAILSGCDHDRTLAAANHQYYADRHELLYVHDTAPTRQGGYNYKLDKLGKFLGHQLAERIFWLDDDAFFMQPDTPPEPFIEEHPEKDLIFCESPVNQHRGRTIQTYISAGNFFIRNTERSRQFIAEARNTPLGQVREWWDETKHGFFFQWRPGRYGVPFARR